MKINHRQQGFVLITSLIFLLVLSLLGIAAVRSTLQEERMSGNDTDKAFARENAELAMRDAERDILGRRFDNTMCAPAACTNMRPVGTRPVSASSTLPFWIATSTDIADLALSEVGQSTGNANTAGFFNAQTAAACGLNIPVWSGANWQDGVNRACAGTINAALNTVAYGFHTDAPFLAAQQNVPRPRYIIEVFTADELGIGGGTSGKFYFRVTTVGFGRNAGVGGLRTSVTLQSVYSPN